MPTKFLTAVVLTLLMTPAAMAQGCNEGDHASTTMSCADGKVFDTATKTCVPVSG